MSNEDILLAVADELKVRNLIAKLAHLADDGSLEDYIKCFAPDAAWGGGGQPLRSGREEILAGAVERREKGITGPGSASRHVITTSWVRVEGDSATARSIFHLYTETDATEPKLRAIGVYDDTFKRDNDAWLLSRRILEGAAKDLPAKR